MRRLLRGVPLLVAFLSCSGPPATADGGALITDDAGVRPDAGVDPDAGADPDAGVVATNPCDTVTCGALETCVLGVCESRRCGASTCPATEACVDAGCVPAPCVGVSCAATEVCVDGSCLPRDCAGITCAAGTVCLQDICVDARCAAVTCGAQERCVAGTCEPIGCGAGGPCATGTTCVGGSCVDSRCVNVSCGAGQQCLAGACVAGCTRTENLEATCGNGLDDDCDGQVDCADPDCDAKACASDGVVCTSDLCSAGSCAHPPAPSTVVCRPSASGCDAVERCTGTSSACPADVFDLACACPYRGPIAGYAEHDGLRSIAAGSFSLRDTGTWSANAVAIDGWGLPRVDLATMSLNRTATRMAARPWVGFAGGFSWETGDLNVTYWVPQGLAGGSAGARKYVAVGWHYEQANRADDANQAVDSNSTHDKGIRVSFADVTDPTTITYRNLLLVEPVAGGRGFVPVLNHIGGMAWVGTLLYVADTGTGVRVFDLTRLSQVSTAAQCSTRCGLSSGVACGYGYEAVLPQVGAYTFPSGLSASCRPQFSFISVDRSTSPPTLLSGEYDNDATYGIYSRVLRWPMLATGRLATTTAGIVTATGAWYAGNRNLQGVAASNGKFFLNSTRYSGALFTGPVNAASHVYRASNDDWGWMPEGAYISTAGNLWVSTEGNSNLPRSVFWARIADIP